MNNRFKNEYHPSFVTPPGETLLETLQTLGWSLAEVSIRTGSSPERIGRILRGEDPITPGMAVALERALGVPAGFWNNLERNYRVWQAKQNPDP